MRALGAEVRMIPSQSGAMTHALMEAMKAEAMSIVAQGDAYYADQFNNSDAVTSYESAGEEIVH
jgi:cysteine synthase A